MYLSYVQILGLCGCCVVLTFCKYVHFFPLFNLFHPFVVGCKIYSLLYKFYWCFYYLFCYWKQFSYRYKAASKQHFFKFHYYFSLKDMLIPWFWTDIWMFLLLNLRQFLFDVQLTIYAWSYMCNCNILNIK